MYKTKLVKTIDEMADGPGTEFEVHAECYCLLKKHFPLVRGEVKLSFLRPRGENGKRIRNERGRFASGGKGARFDLVVYDTNKKALFTVEVKRNESRINTKQRHYEEISGVPCYLVGSLRQCEELIAKLK